MKLLKKAFLLFLCPTIMFCSCKEKRDVPVVTPWGEVLGDSLHSSSTFDLPDIQQAGEMILATVSGPRSYYDYRGQHLGQMYLIVRQFAETVGVGVRVELCRDTTELNMRIDSDDADFYASSDTVVASGSKPLLKEMFDGWMRPQRIAEAQVEERRLVAEGTVKRHVYAPMLDRQGGVISRYDGLFVKYSREIGWDWRLLAAQCYQESTFDVKAVSFAGARGLMQIMPSTASKLGVEKESLYDAETNIAAAARYIRQLDNSLTDIKDRKERQNFVLASYNGGLNHIRDAMALARSEGHSDKQWSQVSPYILKLSLPQYYQNPVVASGYMRGSETVDYVEKIRHRYQQYRRVKTTAPSTFKPKKAVNSKHREKFNTK